MPNTCLLIWEIYRVIDRTVFLKKGIFFLMFSILKSILFQIPFDKAWKIATKIDFCFGENCEQMRKGT